MTLAAGSPRPDTLGPHELAPCPIRRTLYCIEPGNQAEVEIVYSAEATLDAGCQGFVAWNT